VASWLYSVAFRVQPGGHWRVVLVPSPMNLGASFDAMSKSDSLLQLLLLLLLQQLESK
jgi:hypothetical protein